MDYAKCAFYTRHGGAFDRGSADAWYGRPVSPHYFTGSTYASSKVEEVNMSKNEVAAYMAGYLSTTFGQKK